MPIVPVRTPSRLYRVHVGRGLLDEVGAEARRLRGPGAALVVADSNTGRLFGDRVVHALTGAGFRASLATVPAGETSKSPRRLESLWTRLAAMRAGREALVVAVGGGVVGDLAGFAAASWNRGVDLLHIPTTLLAMVDASIGGKTGINLPAGKNLAGAFHQPIAVLADLDTLKTLPARELRAGFAEVLKYGLLGDAALFATLERDARRLLRRDPALLERVVTRCAAAKARIVAADERESGLRLLLNLGHTFAHAIEAETRFRKYLHGEAVAIGLCAAAALSERAGVAGKGLEARVRRAVKAFGLPDRAEGLDLGRLQKLARGDKKVRGGEIRYVVCERVGKAVVKSGLGAAEGAAWRAAVGNID